MSRPFKIKFTAETGNQKRHFLKGTRITRPYGWITLLYILYNFHLRKRKKIVAFLSGWGGVGPPPPLSKAEISEKNAII